MSGVEKRVEKLEEKVQEHDTSIKLHDQEFKTIGKEMAALTKGLTDLNQTVVEKVVPMMSNMAGAKAAKDKFEAKVGKVILGLIALVAVIVSIVVGFFK